MNLLLDTDERENILSILNSIVSISTEERVQLAQTLRTTSLSRILRTIKMIKNRCEVVEQLRNLVFDLKKFSTEREHIQLAIEDNYWLFGEQFHLVSADETFEKALSNYLYVLDGEEKKEQINSPEHNRRWSDLVALETMMFMISFVPLHRQTNIRNLKRKNSWTTHIKQRTVFVCVVMLLCNRAFIHLRYEF